MKKFVAALLLLAVVLLAGCTETKIICGVDEEKNAFLQITMEADWTGVAISMGQRYRSGFRELARYYRDELGFAVEEDYTENGCTLTAELKRPADSYESAFRELETMLTDSSITPFLQVSTVQETQGEVQGFGLDVTLDTGRILEHLGTEDMPSDLREYFRQSIEASAAQLQLVLPGNEVVSGHDTATVEDKAVRTQKDVNLTGQTALSLSTRAIVRDGQIVTTAHEDQEARLQNWGQSVWICAGIFALALILWGALLVTSRRKKAHAVEEPAN